MNLGTSWIIAAKDLRVVIRKKSIRYTITILPLMGAILFPLVIRFVENKNGSIPASSLPALLNSFAFFFAIISAIIPTPIASYSIVGEKVEKSLEPLLATPVTDGEILLGKSLAAFLPSLIASYAGATLFMVLIDNVTRNSLGYLFFPNWNMAIILLLLIPLVATLSVESSVIASARVNDVRAASQLSSLMFLPLIAIYIGSELGLISLDANTLLIISGILAVLDLALFRVSTATFRREEILTRWK